MHATETGIGRALRTARLRRGKSLEEASRETRLRLEYLTALEREEFGDLLGDVYVRGWLRSYSQYLGLDPEKVITVYERAHGGEHPELAPIHRAPGVANGDGLPSIHRRPNWLLAAAAAAIVLLSAGAIGLFSRGSSTPEAADPSPPPSIPVLPRTVEVDLVARQRVSGVVTADGVVQFSGTLEPGEARHFEAEQQIEVELAWGHSVRLRVNGEDLGKLGNRDEPLVVTYTPRDFRER